MKIGKTKAATGYQPMTAFVSKRVKQNIRLQYIILKNRLQEEMLQRMHQKITDLQLPLEPWEPKLNRQRSELLEEWEQLCAGRGMLLNRLWDLEDHMEDLAQALGDLDIKVTWRRTEYEGD